MFQCEELREEVRGALEEVLRARREAEEETSRILNAENLEEAKQLYLIHQVCVSVCVCVLSSTQCMLRYSPPPYL